MSGDMRQPFSLRHAPLQAVLNLLGEVIMGKPSRRDLLCSLLNNVCLRCFQHPSDQGRESFLMALHSGIEEIDPLTRSRNAKIIGTCSAKALNGEVLVQVQDRETRSHHSHPDGWVRVST